MRCQDLSVLKLGGSVLTSDDSLATAVHEIYREVRRGRKVVAVVSARAGATDALERRARRISGEPAPFAYAALLASGEAQSAAGLALALDAAGIPATLLQAHELGLRTCGPPLDAEPCALEPARLLAALERHSAVVVPGFVGYSGSDEPNLLGRGGSDLTAIYLAARLGAGRCRLIKDVEGWLDGDPRDRGARRYQSLHWAEAERRPTRVVQARAVALARREQRPFEVAAPGSDCCTRIGAEATLLADARSLPPPLDVVLLGAGTVGGGVACHLLREPHRFRLRAVLVRDAGRHRDPALSPELLTTDPRLALAHPGAVLVELLGGLEPARGLVEAALRDGRSVVSANKRLFAAHGRELEALAQASGAGLRFSAAVGGCAPMLEAVERLAAAPIVALRGILNGTCNWMLDRIAEGTSYQEALAAARELGYAEAEPTADVEGRDAADKLVLLARRAFRRDFADGTLEVSGIRRLRDVACTPPAPGHSLRLVATARIHRRGAGGTLEGKVGLEWLPRHDPLAAVGGVWNALEIRLADGTRTLVQGRGAGRWPTAEAVLADLCDLRQDSALRRRPAALGVGAR